MTMQTEPSHPVIRAAVFRDDGKYVHFEDVSVAELRDDEVLVALLATGVCHTDLVCRDGMMPLPRPIILGHEGAGHVVRVGAGVTGLHSGDSVVLSFNSCGECENCGMGRANCCDHFAPCNFSGRRLDGSTALKGEQGEVASHFFGQSSFATHSVANVRNVVKVRSDAPLDLLGPLGCGVLTGAGAVLNQLKPQAGQSIVIFGAGGVGLSGVMAAKVAGCAPIIVVEPNPSRRALALELGAAHALDPAAEADLNGKLQELTGQHVSYALDTSGVPAVIQQAIGALAPGGKVALVTGNSLNATVNLPLMEILGKGISIHAIVMGNSNPHTFIPELVDLIVEGRFPLEKLVRFYDFAELDQALEDQESGRTVKPIVRISGQAA